MPVAANGVKQPDITPLEFMLGMMADPKVDPSLRFKAAQASAMYVHAKPTTAAPGDAAGSGPIIDGTADGDPLRARFEAAGKRISELDGLRRFVRSFDKPPPGPLTAAEKVELEELKAWYEAAPAYLKVPEPGSAAAFLAKFPDFGALTASPTPQRFEEPVERRLLPERQPVVEVKESALLPDEPETAPEPVVDDDNDDNGQN
jgi:hypothetical protein